LHETAHEYRQERFQVCYSEIGLVRDAYCFPAEPAGQGGCRYQAGRQSLLLSGINDYSVQRALRLVDDLFTHV
jgi:hypothetical protein